MEDLRVYSTLKRTDKFKSELYSDTHRYACMLMGWNSGMHARLITKFTNGRRKYLAFVPVNGGFHIVTCCRIMCVYVRVSRLDCFVSVDGNGLYLAVGLRAA